MATIAKSKNFISNPTNISEETTESIFDKFATWCEAIENYRYPLMAIIVAIQGCIVIPVALLLAQYINIGLEDVTVIAVAATTMAVMVTNMALTPMKVVVSTFTLNLLINFSLVAIHVIALFR